MDNYNEYLAGGASGIVRIVLGFPIETIKIRAQTGLKNYSVCSLYKGSTGVFFGSCITSAIEFGVYHKTNDKMKNSMVAGVFAGICQLPFTVPMEHVRNRMQNNEINTLNMYKKIIKDSGLVGLYKGTCTTAIRDMIGTGLYFTTYEVYKKYFYCNNYVNHIASGVLAGFVFWLSIYPLDVIKNNIQMNSAYISSIDCVKSIYNKNGIVGFYRGFLPYTLCNIPVNIGIFSVYKYVMDTI